MVRLLVLIGCSVALLACGTTHGAPADAGAKRARTKNAKHSDAAVTADASDAGASKRDGASAPYLDASDDRDARPDAEPERSDAAAAQDAASEHDASPAGAPDAAMNACPDPLAQSEAANLLVLFDQSGSMMEMWESTTKLEAAKAALVSVLSGLGDAYRVGAIFLPDTNPNVSPCIGSPNTAAVQPIDGPGNIPFAPAKMFVEAFNAHWSMTGTGMGLGTPLNEAFDRADVALAPTLAGHGLQGPTAVIVFTDGMPNCWPSPAATGIPTKPEASRAADWQLQRVPTYVMGLPGADGVTYLDHIALAGGTTAALAPGDPQAVVTQLTDVIERQLLPKLPASVIDACGGCSTACKDGTICLHGSCVCPTVGEVLCHGRCITPDSNDNCGACDHACAGGQSCCAEQCVDTNTSANNCGACGAACPDARSDAGACSQGTCHCGTGPACVSPKVCTSQLFANPVCQ